MNKREVLELIIKKSESLVYSDNDATADILQVHMDTLNEIRELARQELKTDSPQKRLAYLRNEIEQERISYEEIVELQSLAPYIPKGDTLLREWAGVKEA